MTSQMIINEFYNPASKCSGRRLCSKLFSNYAPFVGSASHYTQQKLQWMKSGLRASTDNSGIVPAEEQQCQDNDGRAR